MEAVRFTHHVALAQSRFKYPGRRLFFGKARLFGDRIELTGWFLWGRHTRCIPLHAIHYLESYPESERSHLTLFLHSGEVLILYMEDALRWYQFFETWTHYDRLPGAHRVDRLEDAACFAA